jgi:hypothetical protein
MFDQCLKIRKEWNWEDMEWYYSVVDFVGVAVGQADYGKARKYWSKLKERLSSYELKGISQNQFERNGAARMSGIDQIELVTKVLDNCLQFKMIGKDMKTHPTDAMNIKSLEILIKFIPSPKIKAFLVQVEKVKYELKNPPIIINF